jgi:hypothetical protein
MTASDNPGTTGLVHLAVSSHNDFSPGTTPGSPISRLQLKMSRGLHPALHAGVAVRQIRHFSRKPAFLINMGQNADCRLSEGSKSGVSFSAIRNTNSPIH